MPKTEKSPRITDYSWGRIVIDKDRTFRDAKLFPGGSKEWDWNQSGTRHRPGILPADVRELLEHGAKVVVLSRGVNNNLGVPQATVDLLESNGVTVHVSQTDKAIELYNKLRDSEAVGGLFHTTC